MALRRRPVPAAGAPPSPDGVRVVEGAFEYFRDGVGPREGRFVPAKFKAAYEGDPGGPYGFGDAPAEAEAMLRRYAALQDELREG